MIRSYRRIKWKKMMVFGFIVITVFSLGAAFWGYRNWQRCLLEKQALEMQLDSYCHMVYVAAEKLPKGSILTPEKLNLEMRYFDLDNMNFITEEAFGKAIAFDVEEGTCVTTEMIYTEERNEMEIFLADIVFKDYVQIGDRVDVRIRYENAEDFTVLVDKIVKKYDAGSGIVLELTEEEILYISSAFTDKKTYDGTSLYVAKYPEYNHVAAGTVNYIPNNEILTLLGREKTEGESRAELEKRLMQKQ